MTKYTKLSTVWEQDRDQMLAQEFEVGSNIHFEHGSFAIALQFQTWCFFKELLWPKL